MPTLSDLRRPQRPRPGPPGVLPAPPVRRPPLETAAARVGREVLTGADVAHRPPSGGGRGALVTVVVALVAAAAALLVGVFGVIGGLGDLVVRTSDAVMPAASGGPSTNPSTALDGPAGEAPVVEEPTGDRSTTTGPSDDAPTGSGSPAPIDGPAADEGAAGAAGERSTGDGPTDDVVAGPDGDTTRDGAATAGWTSILARGPDGEALRYRASEDGNEVVAATLRPHDGGADDVLVVLSVDGRPVLRHDVVRGARALTSAVLADAYQPAGDVPPAATPLWLPGADAFVLADRAAWGAVLRVVGWQGGPGTDDLATDVVLLDLPTDPGPSARVVAVTPHADGALVLVATPSGPEVTVDLHQRSDGSWVDRASLHPTDPARNSP